MSFRCTGKYPGKRVFGVDVSMIQIDWSMPLMITPLQSFRRVITTSGCLIQVQPQCQWPLMEMRMAFSELEKQALLAVKGVGPTVVKRFEEVGIDSFDKLSTYDSRDIAEMVASMLRTTCWKNSPKALSAVDAAISRARMGL